MKSMVALWMLIAFINTANAQSTAATVATASIVTPYSVGANQNPDFEKIIVTPAKIYQLLSKGGGNKFSIIKINAAHAPHKIAAVDVAINGIPGSLYNVMIDETVTLVNAWGSEKIMAEVESGSYLKTSVLINGNQSLKPSAVLHIDKDQVPGKYVSENFEVTVSFN